MSHNDWYVYTPKILFRTNYEFNDAGKFNVHEKLKMFLEILKQNLKWTQTKKKYCTLKIVYLNADYTCKCSQDFLKIKKTKVF